MTAETKPAEPAKKPSKAKAKDLIHKQRDALKAVARDAALEVLAEMTRMSDAERLSAMSRVAGDFRKAFVHEFNAVCCELLLNPK